MNKFQNALIAICGFGNDTQLETDVRKAYARAEEHMMVTAKYQRDLTIAKATLAQVNDTSKSDHEIKANLEKRLQSELSSASEAQHQLTTCVNDHGKVTEKTHAGYWGRWWWWGGHYSYTTRHEKDTTSEQNAAKAKIRMADERVEEIRQRISNNAFSRAKLKETAEGDITALETKITEETRRAEEAFNVARRIEDQLNNARLEAAGCDASTRVAISSSFKVAFPLFQRLTESVAKVSANYETMKTIIACQQSLGIIELLGITDELMKMAILGDYSSNASFYLCSDPLMSQLANARATKINEALTIVRSAAVVDAGKVMELKQLTTPSNTENNVFNVKPVTTECVPIGTVDDL